MTRTGSAGDGSDYVGRRIVVMGAAGAIGAEVTAALVAAGGEVHAVDQHEIGLGGLASRTATNLYDPAEIAAALGRIGAVVHHLFHCPEPPEHASCVELLQLRWCAFREVTQRVAPLMVERSTIVGLGSRGCTGAVDARVTQALRDGDFGAARQWCDDSGEHGDAAQLAGSLVDGFVADHARLLAADGIRLLCPPAETVGPDDAPQAVARVLVRLGAPN